MREFLEGWLRFHEPRDSARRMNTYLIIDPPHGSKKEPAYTAMVVIGLGADQGYYLVDALRDQLDLPERSDALFEMHRRWRPLVVGYESEIKADIEHYQERMSRENYRFKIIELDGSLARDERIRRLIPICAAERLWLPQSLEKMDYQGHTIDLVVSFVNDEYKAFPAAAHDDILSCISRVLDIDLVWPRPRGTSIDPRRREHRWSQWSA